MINYKLLSDYQSELINKLKLKSQHLLSLPMPPPPKKTPPLSPFYLPLAPPLPSVLFLIPGARQPAFTGLVVQRFHVEPRGKTIGNG